MKLELRVIEGPDAGGSVVVTERDRIVIGRSTETQLVIANDPQFSRFHMMLEVDPPRLQLLDLSTGGTYVNGVKVSAIELHDGDVIAGGETRIGVTVEHDPDELRVDTSKPPTAPIDISQLLGPQDPNAVVPVRCGRCGNRASNEVDRSRAEGMAYFCDGCQGALVDNPVLPAGYRLIRRLGGGAMGTVYLVEHDVLGERAIKMILPKVAMTKRARDMFVREVSVQARIEHPRVVRVYDFKEVVPAIFCMVMEYAPGQSGEDLILANPSGLDPRLAAQIVAQALSGLAEIHDKGIVHRDIKDANLLVTENQPGKLAVKVADFGLAKWWEKSGASGITNTGDISGTPAYMPPEQVIDFKRAKPPADIYAMGATLYRLLSGQFPHDFRANVIPYLTILEDPIVPIRERRPAVPAAFEDVISRAMQRDPEARYKDAEEMRRAVLAAIP